MWSWLMQMDALSEEEASARLGYDDVNECFCSETIVHAALKQLGIGSGVIASRDAHHALMALTVWIGSPMCTAAWGQSLDGSAENLNSLMLDAVSGAESAYITGTDWFSSERAAAFWSAQVGRIPL